MDKELKDSLINKLINQQTIVQNSSSETDFRRAEVTANIIGRIVDLENLMETIEIKKEMGIPVIEFEMPKKEEETKKSVGVSLSKKTEERFIKSVEKDFHTKISVRQRILDLLKEEKNVMTRVELMLALGVTKSNSNSFSVQLVAMKNDLAKFDKLDGFSKCQFSYGLKEWVETNAMPYRLFEDKVKEEKEEKPKSTIKLKTHNRPDDDLHKKDKEKICPIKNMNGFQLQNSIEYLDVLSNKSIGNIVWFTDAGKQTLKGDVYNHDTATIRDAINGTLYDRPFNKFRKR